MAKKIKVIAMILFLISSWSMEIAESSASDCYDACCTRCVQSNTMQRCDRKCQIECIPWLGFGSKFLQDWKPCQSSKKITLKSSDGESFKVDEAVAFESPTIKNMMEDTFDDCIFPLFDLIRAAKYLNMKSLLDLTCQTFADMIKEKCPEEIRRTFNIKNDFTTKEEGEILMEKRTSGNLFE